MGKTIAVANVKGGVGKTTLTNALAHQFSREGKRVLVVDLDPQATQTFLFGVTPKQVYGTEHDITNAFSDKPVKPLPVYENIDLIPSHRGLTVEAESGKSGKDMAIPSVIKEVQHEYDYVLIDPAPTTGTLMTSTILSAEYLIIPTKFSTADKTGVMSLLTIINSLDRKFFKFMNLPPVKLIGIVPIGYRRRYTEHEKTIADYKINIPTVIEKINNLELLNEEVVLRHVLERQAWVKAQSPDYNLPIHDFVERYAREQKDILYDLKLLANQIQSFCEITNKVI